MDIVYSEKCLEFKQNSHPESPERVRAAYEFLKNAYTFLKPKPCSEEDLLKVHTQKLINSVKQGSFSDPDCPRYENIFSYARLSAGAAMLAAKKKSFSLMRPPGHHAGKDFLAGFCYFNNIAIAVESLSKKTLIIDFDGHHGNGTQDIFLGSKDVTFISLHRSPHYPGTGLSSEKNCLNFPLEAFCGEKIYLKTLDKALKQAGNNFDIIAVSAGFDAYEKDSLASLGLKTETYKKIGKLIGKLELPCFAVLEGGYVVEYLGNNIQSFLEGLRL